MRDTRNENGFTLVELLVALMVMSIILTAVATLAHTLGMLNDGSNDTSQKQAQLRYATLRVSELIRNCKLICGEPGDDLAIWRADDNGNGKINVNELVYIESGSGRDYLRLCEFSSLANPEVSLLSLKSPVTKGALKSNYEEKYAQMIPQCSNVVFSLDTSVPQAQFVSISLDLQEDSFWHNYQISNSLRSWAGNLIDESTGELVSDDD